MWKKISLLSIGCLLLSGFGCNLNQDKDPIIVPVLEDEFYLDLWQALSPDGASLVIEFMTLKEEACLNAEVLSSYQHSNRSLTLTLFDILAPETCLPGSAPARGEEHFTNLAPGTYQLTVELQEVVSNEGTLRIDDSGFQVETPTNGFQWRHGRIERMPTTALWGYLSYTEETERVVVEQRLAQLAEFSTPPVWSAGYYGYFDLAEDNSVILAARLLPEGGDFVPFLVQYENANALTTWLENTEAQLSEGMSLRVFNGVGQEWTY